MDKGKFCNSDKTYDDFSNLFKIITNKHAPVQEKKVRGKKYFVYDKRTQKSYHG